MILDTSVAAKWCLPGEAEAHREAANELLHRFQVRQVHLCVPDLFWPEMTNVLAQAALRGRLLPEAASEALAFLRGLGLLTLPTLPFAERALQMALRWRRPAYDLYFVLLASSTHDELITADERLVRALGSWFPVRWLGALA